MNGREGLRSCCNVKAVLDDRFPLHFPSKLFPVGAGDFDRISGAVLAGVRPAACAASCRGVELVRGARGATT